VSGDAFRHTARLIVVAAILAASLVLVASALADLGAVRGLPRMFADKPAISNSRSGTFIVRADRMTPGKSVRGSVRIVNKGGAAGVLYVSPRNQLDKPGPYGAELSTKLYLTIRVVGRHGTTTLWRGYLSGMGKVRLGVLRRGVARTYRFIVTFRMHPPARQVLTDNDFQKSRFTTDFVWKIVPLR
jgi:hypothetical protein